MICFEEFLGQLKERLTERFCEDYEIQTDVIQKVNGVEKTGLQIRKKGANAGIVVYPMDIYNSIQKGSGFQEVFDQLLHAMEKSLKQIGSEKITGKMEDCFLNYEEASKYLVYRLVQTKRNQKLLMDVPHIPYLDLSIIFELYWKMDGKNCTVLIHNNHLKYWGVEPEELLARAKENTPRLLPAKFDAVDRLFCSVANPVEIANWWEHKRWENLWMYFLSNQAYFHGAAAVLYEGVLKKIADQIDSDLIVLPSSTHEVLLIPSRLWPDADGFAELIQDINQTQVEEEEWLSDHPYRYLRETDQLVAA